MWNLFWIILIIILFVKGKKWLSKLWGSVNSDSKLVIVERPSKYREYNPYIHLSEVIHWEVMSEMGEARNLIRQDINGALELIIGSEGYAPEVTMTELAERWEQVGKNFRNYDLFSVFFRLIAKKAPIQRYQLKIVVAFINTAV